MTYSDMDQMMSDNLLADFCVCLHPIRKIAVPHDALYLHENHPTFDSLANGHFQCCLEQRFLFLK